MLLSLLACEDQPSNEPRDSGDSDTDTDTDTGPKPWLVPDFALVDLNTSSPTYGHTISPREKKGHASGWYFIHAD
jgi:hypothetical protein